MSTYNGEEYICQQIDSILNQDCEKLGLAKVYLHVRDDGSKDKTLEILDQYKNKYPDIFSWEKGENLGPKDSFFNLIANSKDCDYYALSDQDDFWLDSKLSQGIKTIDQIASQKSSPIPILYTCRVLPVNENLEALDSNINRSHMQADFKNALIENIVNGCCTVFNEELRLLTAKHLPNYTFMHDWWLYLLASSFGEVYFDDNPYLYYRQHGDNSVGINTSRFKEMNERLKNRKRDKNKISRQLSEFVRLFENDESYNSNENFLIAKEFVELKNKNIFKRRKFLKAQKLFRQRASDNRIFQILLSLGKY